jgi:hypothetical protein
MSRRPNLFLLFGLSVTVVLLVLTVPNKSEGGKKFMIETENKIRGLIDKFTESDDLDVLENAIDEIDAIEEPAGSLDKDYDLYRKAKLKLILDIYNSIDSKTIPDFDFDDMPDLTIAPPAETGLPSGVSPESVKTKSMKEKFEKEIQENQQKKEVYNYQLKLKKLDDYNTANFKEHISTKYTRKVGDLAEIETIVDEVVNSAQRRTSLNEILMNPNASD